MNINQLTFILIMLLISMGAYSNIPKNPVVVSEYPLIDIISEHGGYTVIFSDENSTLQEIDSNHIFYKVILKLDTTSKVIWERQPEVEGTMESGWYRGTYYVYITNYSIIKNKGN